MDERTLFDALMGAASIADLEKAILAYRGMHGVAVSEVPFGRRPNNRGAIEVSSDAGRSAIERVTNAHDALLELEYERHGGMPEVPITPRSGKRLARRANQRGLVGAHE